MAHMRIILGKIPEWKGFLAKHRCRVGQNAKWILNEEGTRVFAECKLLAVWNGFLDQVNDDQLLNKDSTVRSNTNYVFDFVRVSIFYMCWNCLFIYAGYK
jgi:hypothetical protein